MSLRFEQAETLITAIGLYSELADYSPIFVGSMPIDIDVPGSDVDVICEVSDHAEFARTLDFLYGDQPDFLISPIGGGKTYTICRFSCVNFAIEIFGQNKPVKSQNAYIHMEVERKLLTIGGETAREAIRSLKRQGIQTEPAFATHFNLEGNPYKRLLEFENMSLSDILTELG
ncbi:MAG: DUF4269 domain-containing protein [Sneathiella sp.]